MMNWMGILIQKEIKKTDTVLDLGCGIFQATTDSLTKTSGKGSFTYRLRTANMQKNLECKSLLGCELVDKYIDVAKSYFPVIKMDISKLENYKMFADKSFDVVMAIDVLEHIPIGISEKIIEEMKRISRNKVIVYTPSKFELNEENTTNAWNLGENPFQQHLSFVSPDILKEHGFKRITFPEPDKNTFAIWEKSEK